MSHLRKDGMRVMVTVRVRKDENTEFHGSRLAGSTGVLYMGAFRARIHIVERRGRSSGFCRPSAGESSKISQAMASGRRVKAGKRERLAFFCQHVLSRVAPDPDRKFSRARL